jgi:hypothetical protein
MILIITKNKPERMWKTVAQPEVLVRHLPGATNECLLTPTRYIWSKHTVFWDAFRAESITAALCSSGI